MTTYWHDDATAHPPVGTWMWHLHHMVLAEPLTFPLAERLAYIRESKPKGERATRLGCIDIVRGELPPALVEARAALRKAYAAWAKAYAALDEARAALDEADAARIKADAAALPALEALHTVEHPGCPWDGKTIFPGAGR